MRRISSSVTALLVLIFSIHASAAPTVTITPEYLRRQVIDNNMSILTELNQVYQTKLQINAARAQLLPSLNLGMSMSHGPSFLLSTVSMLLPFLVPSNWFNLNQSRYVFEAEKHAYYLLELNTFASAYSVYISVLGDVELRSILNKQYENLLKIQHDIETRNYFGVASDTDLQQARSQTALARNQLAQMDETLVKETASFRKMLALPLTTRIKFNNHRVSGSLFENKPSAKVLQAALSKSPEYAQVASLISAGQEGNWAKVFAFINNSTLTSVGQFGSSASLSNFSAGASFNLGFGYFPALELSQAAVDKLQLRHQEIEFEQGEIVESSLGSIKQALIEYDQAQKAEVGLNQVLESQIENYNLGLTDLLHVLDTQNSVTQASVARVKARVDLDSIRINLHRIMLSEQFSKIYGCQAVQEPRRFFRGVQDQNGNASRRSVDEQCKATPQ